MHFVPFFLYERFLQRQLGKYAKCFFCYYIVMTSQFFNLIVILLHGKIEKQTKNTKEQMHI